MDAWLSRRRTPIRTRRDSLLALVLLTLVVRALSPSSASAQGAGADSVRLAWTAPGDDGNVGTATRYEMRMSSALITESNWSAASLVPGAPDPRPGGTRQGMVVRGLTRGVTYYFAIKAIDDAGNQAAISNVVKWDWILDTAPPAAPSGVAAAVENGGGAVRVRWSANAEPDLAGYTVYRGFSVGGPYQALNATPIGATEYVDSGLPPGTAAVWYQVTASDLTGNESARSATATVSLQSTANQWSLMPAFPNPSSVSSPVNIPLEVPAAGAGGATLEIVGAGGHLIRRLDLSGLGGGPQTVVWDGRNAAGLMAAPGVYTAWLVGGGAARSLKLVRVP